MSHLLRCVPFEKGMVQSFECGQEPWAVECATWITTDACIEDMKSRGTQVWLYYDSDNQLVGYGSLGVTKWRIPPGTPKQDVSIIPFVAVQTKFRGKPDGVEWKDRYSSRILRSLMKRAQSNSLRYLVLAVDGDNLRAIEFYRRLGFFMLPDKVDGYSKMHIELNPPPDMGVAPSQLPSLPR